MVIGVLTISLAGKVKFMQKGYPSVIVRIPFMYSINLKLAGAVHSLLF